MISRNYHHIESHPLLSNLFPREQEDNQISQKYSLQVCSSQIEMMVMMVVMVVLEVLEGMVRMNGGMVPTTAQHLRGGVNVMSVITWWRPLPSSLHTSIGGL